MDADEFKVIDVLKRNERFVVPLYQRQYQWHDAYDGKRTLAFWNDVAAKAVDVLDNNAKFDHYMGALLPAPTGIPRSFGVIPAVQVVDGQQRLTTFLIIISAIKEFALRENITHIADQCDKLLFNELGRADKDHVAKFKLTPTPIDREVFLTILSERADKIRLKLNRHYWGGGVPKNTTFRALRAYEFFLEKISEFVREGEGDDSEDELDAVGEKTEESAEGIEPEFERRLAALLEALVFHLKLIVITLGEEDDAQVIFETLNSAGQPLLAMDLVRNNIFQRAEAQFQGTDEGKQKAEEIYREAWQPFDHGWWREPAPNARPSRPRIDHFLAHVLTAESGERTTVRELYAEYRAWATPKRVPRFANVEDELAVLQKHVPTYEGLEGRPGSKETIRPPVGWMGQRLRLWQNTTVYPVVFQLADQISDDAELQKTLEIINSYFTRRALCGLTPKNLNQVFPRLTSFIATNGASIGTLAKFFDLLTGDSVRFPGDGEMRSAIPTLPAYRNIPSRILSELLWAFELDMRTKLTENTSRPSALWVEHVMPQSWEEHWPLNGVTGDDLTAETPGYWAREESLQTLGNLTITTDRLNISMGKLPFDEKKSKLVDHSNLTLNKRICEATDWSEKQIGERSADLAERAIRMWPSTV